jgi:hypothetical protein
MAPRCSGPHVHPPASSLVAFALVRSVLRRRQDTPAADMSIFRLWSRQASLVNEMNCGFACPPSARGPVQQGHLRSNVSPTFNLWPWLKCWGLFLSLWHPPPPTSCCRAAHAPPPGHGTTPWGVTRSSCKNPLKVIVVVHPALFIEKGPTRTARGDRGGYRASQRTPGGPSGEPPGLLGGGPWPMIFVASGASPCCPRQARRPPEGVRALASRSVQG